VLEKRISGRKKEDIGRKKRRRIRISEIGQGEEGYRNDQVRQGGFSRQDKA
jgi:hypothetical protein